MFVTAVILHVPRETEYCSTVVVCVVALAESKDKGLGPKGIKKRDEVYPMWTTTVGDMSRLLRHLL